MPEAYLVRANAYILFYCRKDATSKAIDELYPKIEEIFPGKPVRVAPQGARQAQPGYVLGAKVQQQQRRTDGPRQLGDHVLVKVNDAIEEVRRDDLEVDRDLLRDL